MEAGSKDRPPTLAPGNYVQWKSRIKRYIDTKPNSELIYYCLQNPPYTYQWTEKTVPVAEGIDNDIYSTFDACPNACGMWKTIERLKQDESINVQDLETILLSLENSTSRDSILQLQPNGKEPATVTEDEEMSKEKEIDKLMALIFLSFKGTGYDNQRAANVAGARKNVSLFVQKPKRVKDAAYHKEKMLLCKQEKAGVQLNAEQADWKDDTNDESDDQELEAHYMYMTQIQEVTPDPVDNSRPIFNDEPMHKLIEIILFIIDFGCSKHLTGNLKLLTNFVEKFLGTVKFGNYQIAPILSYGDLV
ncbi:hypothetical protein Tco_1094224 [Tanacetum coccineum]|uniref:Integrase, catalytic region, zinc finger, CCHC-type, peptidase aspartic, catalytic n=1 Tax=Tanacetum coccineum TaxID=301880 RepID=A0ABQ5IEW9_9ASTR